MIIQTPFRFYYERFACVRSPPLRRRFGGVLRRLNGQTTQAITGLASPRGRDNVNKDALCAGATSQRRKKCGILRRTGQSPQGGRHRRQQPGFEGGPALDTFLSGDFLQYRLITIFPVAGIGRQDHGHDGFFRPLCGRGLGERRQLRQGAQRGHHFIIGTFVLPIPPPLAERFPFFSSDS